MMRERVSMMYFETKQDDKSKLILENQKATCEFHDKPPI